MGLFPQGTSQETPNSGHFSSSVSGPCPNVYKRLFSSSTISEERARGEAVNHKRNKKMMSRMKNKLRKKYSF